MYPEEAWNYFINISKILLMTFITLRLFQDPRRLIILTWVIVLSLGFYGVKAGIWAFLTGGQYRVWGPPGTFLEDNTSIGLALNMVLPLVLFLRSEETRPWLRHTLLAMFFTTVACILITYSRGAFLGLAVVIFMLIMRSRIKLIALICLLVALPLSYKFLPEKWFNRIETIQTYQEDKSAMSRIGSWHVAYRIALDRPLLGAGFRPFTVENYARYHPDGVLSRNDAHSIYFQVLAEHGFVGLGLYLGLIVSTLLGIRQTIKESRGDPNKLWIHNYARMLQISILAFLISGAFLSVSYFDLFFHFIAIAIILRSLTLNQTNEAHA